MGGQAELSSLPISFLLLSNMGVKFSNPAPPFANMQAALTCGPPLNVSPLIRATRWSLLVAGITYGYMRHNYLSKIEVVQQAEDDQVRAVLNQRAMEHAAATAMEELNRLAPDFSVTNRVTLEDCMPKQK